PLGAVRLARIGRRGADSRRGGARASPWRLPDPRLDLPPPRPARPAPQPLEPPPLPARAHAQADPAHGRRGILGVPPWGDGVGLGGASTAAAPPSPYPIPARGWTRNRLRCRWRSRVCRWLCSSIPPRLEARR